MRDVTLYNLFTILVTLMLSLSIVGCEDGKVENAGEKIDDAINDAGNAVEDACEEATKENC